VWLAKSIIVNIISKIKRKKKAYNKEYRKNNREKVLQQQRDHYHRNSKNIIAQTNENAARNRAFRSDLLAQFPCYCCNDPNPTVIQWHHVVPKDKCFSIKMLIAKPHDIWWDEVLKCIPVCANCHLKIHKNKLCLLLNKPTESQLKKDIENTCAVAISCHR